MLLLTGPPGSGKSSFVLVRFHEALEQRTTGVRLIVPTTTMAEHLRNQIAREGFVFRPGLIVTLSKFIEPWTSDLPEVSRAELYLLVESALFSLNRPEFARVAHMSGFSSSLARLIEELSSSGSDWQRLDRALRKYSLLNPLQQAFVAVYRRVEEELERRGVGMRGARLGRTAERIRSEGVGSIDTIWLDGFFSLADPEVELVAAMSRHANVTVTLVSHSSTEDTRRRLLRLGREQRLEDHKRAEPEVELFKAPTVDQEACDIARMIIEEAVSGREFREIGIVVRSPLECLPALRGALDRFGIPAHYYFPAPLIDHGVTQFLSGAVDAMLGGWDHLATLAVLKMAGSGAGNAMDRFDFELRKQLPGCGLEKLRTLASSIGDQVLARIEQLARLEKWRDLELPASAWAERAKTLTGLYRPPVITDGQSDETVMLWRGQATALRQFEGAMEQTAACFENRRAISLPEFWRIAKAVLRLTTLRIPDHRRNVVHVLSAHEARQWELPVIFVCGLLEKQFPRYHAQDPIFPDPVRRTLKKAGLRLRTSADLEAEERFLFELVKTRATARLVLSYAEMETSGERNLPSFFLGDFAKEARPAAPVRPAPAVLLGKWRPGPVIRDPELLRVIAERHATVKPSALETFFKCPFQFFGFQTLRLDTRPRRPEERLDALLRGEIVHKVLAEWGQRRQPIAALFERIFREVCEQKNVAMGYQTEAWRMQMQADLERFAADSQWSFSSESLTEVNFDWQAAPGLTITGRIDRIDKLPDGRAVVIDYKYSSVERFNGQIQQRHPLQGALYAAALQHALGIEPAAMLFCAMRDGVRYAGWTANLPDLASPTDDLTPEWIGNALGQTLEIATTISQGKIAPEPYDMELCASCQLRDVCRYAGAAEAAREA